jgi:hypothetical protein
MSKNQQRPSNQGRKGPRANEGTRRPAWVVEGGGTTRKRPHVPARGRHAPASKIYSQARVKHASARGGWKGGSLVADYGGDGQEPNGGARVLPRLPKNKRTDFEKNISKDFKKKTKPRLGEADDDGGQRFSGGGWGIVIIGQRYNA